MDGLADVPDAIGTVFPRAARKTRLVYLVRNSVAFASWDDRKTALMSGIAFYWVETAEREAA